MQKQFLILTFSPSPNTRYFSVGGKKSFAHLIKWDFSYSEEGYRYPVERMQTLTDFAGKKQVIVLYDVDGITREFLVTIPGI